MNAISLALPPLDLLAHNLVALLVAIVAVMLLSQVILSATVRISRLFLSAAIFKEVTEEDHEALRKQVRRRSLVAVSIVSLGLLVAALVGSFKGVRALDLVKAALGEIKPEDLYDLKKGLLGVAAIAFAALIVDGLARGLTAALDKVFSRSQRLAPRREPLARVFERLRTALRVIILCVASSLSAEALGLPGWAQRVVVVVSYALGAFYGSRFVTAVAYILVDLLFETSGQLNRLDSPLRYLGGLTHLAGVTKRTIDYFVYVGAATWVADQLTPDTWFARAGHVGIRIIAIFYASRVLVEICILFMHEIFLGKSAGVEGVGLQRRQTLVPVAVGLLRYGIYFSALVMVLRVVEIDPTPLLAGAGVLGVAVGLGAQAFVGDIVAGFFILFEDLILVGDLVEVAGVKGKVEEIGVRITKIRDDSGVLHAIPNGEVRKVANHSKAYVNAVVDVFIPYEEDLQAVRALLRSVSEATLEAETGRRGEPEVKVQELAEGSINLRVIARVPPGKDEDVSDVMRENIAEGLRRAGVGAPRARQVVMIDSGLRVGAPKPKEKGEKQEDEGPPKPFEPKGNDPD
jgi:moderate conductance mechanosensitive channel